MSSSGPSDQQLCCFFGKLENLAGALLKCGNEWKNALSAAAKAAALGKLEGLAVSDNGSRLRANLSVVVRIN